MRIIRFPQALSDLVDAAMFIAEDDFEVADRVFDAFEESIEIIRQNPQIGVSRKFRDHRDIRMWFLRGFEKYLIFYTEDAEEIAILRIIHSARDYTRFFC